MEGLFCGLRGRVDAWLGRLTAVEEQCRGGKFAGHSGWSGGKDILLIAGSIVLRRFGIGVVAGLEGGSVKDGFFLRCSGFRSFNRFFLFGFASQSRKILLIFGFFLQRRVRLLWRWGCRLNISKGSAGLLRRKIGWLLLQKEGVSQFGRCFSLLLLFLLLQTQEFLIFCLKFAAFFLLSQDFLGVFLLFLQLTNRLGLQPFFFQQLDIGTVACQRREENAGFFQILAGHGFGGRLFRCSRRWIKMKNRFRFFCLRCSRSRCRFFFDLRLCFNSSRWFLLWLYRFCLYFRLCRNGGEGFLYRCYRLRFRLGFRFRLWLFCRTRWPLRRDIG